MKSIASLLVLSLLCAVAADAAAAPELPGGAQLGARAFGRSAATRGGESAAVAALVDAAEREFAGSRPAEAAAPLERALRIEPRNAALWHYLGLVYLELGNYTQAEAMAAKSRSLAGSNRTLRALNARLTAAALRAQGKSVPPPSDAPLLASRTPPDTTFEPAAAYVDRDTRRARERRSWVAVESTSRSATRTPPAAPRDRLGERGTSQKRKQAAPSGDCELAARRQARCHDAPNGHAEQRALSSPAEQGATQRTERRTSRRYGWRTGVDI
jgi:tetratricopeptide (TPR) repeat protein